MLRRLPRLGRAVLRPHAIPAYQSIGSVRWMGIFDRATESVNEWRSKQAAKKSKELAKAQMDYLKSLDHFGMTEFKAQLQDLMRLSGVSGWKATFRTKEEQEELDQKFTESKVADALNEDELADPTTIRRRAKLRIAADAGVDVSAVNRFLRSFEEMKELHRWLQARKEQGLPLPETHDDYIRMLMADRSNTKLRNIKKTQGRMRGWRAAMR